MPKRNLTIRLDDELREQLQLIADKEMRPLANQIVYYLVGCVEDYKRINKVEFVPEEGCFKPVEESFF